MSYKMFHNGLIIMPHPCDKKMMIFFPGLTVHYAEWMGVHCFVLGVLILCSGFWICAIFHIEDIIADHQ